MFFDWLYKLNTKLFKTNIYRFHADRWEPEKPYVVIRKSKKFTGYTDNRVEDVTQRSLIYLTDSAMNGDSFNNSRGMVMNQLLRFMGFYFIYILFSRLQSPKFSEF